MTSSEKKKEFKTEVRIHTEAHINDHCFISIDVNIDEVFRELDDDDLAAAFERRAKKGEHKRVSKLTLIYEEFARRGDAPQILKDYVYEMIGRIL
jgi:hypothetical protein